MPLSLRKIFTSSLSLVLSIIWMNVYANSNFLEIQKEAEKGIPEAQNRLGWLYSQGQEVSQDYQKAAFWYKKAAEQGLPGAQTHLGLLYYEGRGVPQDYLLSYMWLNLASAQNFVSAIELRNLLVKAYMEPKQVIEAQQLTREWLNKHKETSYRKVKTQF